MTETRKHIHVRREALLGDYIKVTDVAGYAKIDGRYDLNDILLVTSDYRTIIDQWKHRAVGFVNVTQPNKTMEHVVIENDDYVVLEGIGPEGIERNGDFIGTYTGKHFYLIGPRPEDICIEDIAQPLSQTCRFVGHTHGICDVASHSCNVQDITRRWGYNTEVQLYALLHDAHEAYTGDMSKPYKLCLSEAARREVDEISANIQRTIYRHLGLIEPSSEIKTVIKEADNYILALEARKFMVNTDGWDLVETKAEDRLRYTKPGEIAAATFMMKLDELMRAAKRR